MGTGNRNATPPLRTACAGWSSSAIRRNLLFLYGVDESALEHLEGFALTLTVKTCPPSGADWTRARDAFLVVLRRSGVVCVHWVTEWQRRGVPHLHLACYWSPESVPDPSFILAHWLRIAAPYGAARSGQHSAAIYDALGWNQYTSKHAARGLRHYQRSPENVPAQWRGASTGRMWGKLGDWPAAPAFCFDVTSQAHFVLRRRIRAWRIAHARARPGVRGRSITAARRMLTCHIETLSRVRGVSEWVPQEIMLRLVEAVAASHGGVESI